MKPRVVFDAVVFLQGAGRPARPARACFALLDQGTAELCLSAEVLVEARVVLTRPTLRERFPLLTDTAADTFLQTAERKAVVVATVPQVFSDPRDPKDEKYVNLALAAGAKYLVTRDKDLLDLMNDAAFRNQYSDLTILDPVAFLKYLSQADKPELPTGG